MTKRLLLLLILPLLLGADETMLPLTDSTNDGNTSCDADAFDSLDDDPAGGDWCVADSNNDNWVFVFTMDDPSGALDTSADAQTIRYYARSFDEGQGDDPTIQMFIYDTTTVACDTLHESGTLTTLTDAGFPNEISDTWTAAGLSSGTDVCVMIDCTKSGGSPGNRNSCDIDNVVWDVTLSVGRSRRMF